MQHILSQRVYARRRSSDRARFLRKCGRPIVEKSVYSLDGKEAKTEFDTFKIFQLIMCLLMVGVSLAIGNQILLLCSLVILPVNVSSYVRNLYSAVGEFKKYSRYTNINTLMIFVINVILLFIINTFND